MEILLYAVLPGLVPATVGPPQGPQNRVPCSHLRLAGSQPRRG